MVLVQDDQNGMLAHHGVLLPGPAIDRVYVPPGVDDDDVLLAW